MNKLFAAILIATVSATAFAQAPATHKSKKPVSIKTHPAKSHRQAIEEATPTEDPDPSIKLSEEELATARRVYTGLLPCELGEKVTIKAMKRDGFFFVSRGIYKYVMHPVDSRTGAIRLEDPVRGAVWLQLGNKSMLLNQKEGKRIADDCKSPEQVEFAQTHKAIDLLAPPTHNAAPAPAH